MHYVLVDNSARIRDGALFFRQLIRKIANRVNALDELSYMSNSHHYIKLVTLRITWTSRSAKATECPAYP